MNSSPTEFLKMATNTAEHFGFRTIEQFEKEPLCRNCENKIRHTVQAGDKKLDSHQGLLIGPVADYFDKKLHALEAPVLLFGSQPAPRSGDMAVTFHIFNVQKSIAEAILIQATRSLLNDLGLSQHVVRINSLGDTDSTTRYSRELANFLKKRLDVMPVTARELMKEHSILALMHLVEKDHELAMRSPNPLEHLSDQSRKHFREIVEYLDMSDTPYEIDPRMLGHHECYSDALFSFAFEGEETPSINISGGRFDEYMYRRSPQRTPATGVVITLNNTKPPVRTPRVKKNQSSVYVVQLGFGPKIQSLLIVEQLKKAGIPVYHDLANDSLSAQLRDAESKEVKYTIIIGQKEFVDKTVILRDMAARNQENVSQDILIRKLKKQSLAPVT